MNPISIIIDGPEDRFEDGLSNGIIDGSNDGASLGAKFCGCKLVDRSATKPGWRRDGLWIYLVFPSDLRKKVESLRWVSKAHIPHRLAIESSSANFDA
jgi:hypothetical protein